MTTLETTPAPEPPPPIPNRGSGARRALFILQRLLQGPTTRAELYDALNVGPKTLARDLATIQDSGFPLYQGRVRVHLEPLAIRNVAHAPVVRDYLERRIPELLAATEETTPQPPG